MGAQTEHLCGRHYHPAPDGGHCRRADLLWQRTSVAGIFAAGDVASFHDGFGRRTRRESWDNAQRQGIAAGNAMLGRTSPIDPYPWFWSDQYDQNIQIVGTISEDPVSIEQPATTG